MKALIAFLGILSISFTGFAGLPLLGMNLRLNGVELLLLPRTSENFFRNVIYDGIKGLDLLEKRNANEAFAILKQMIKDSNSERNCSRKMSRILSSQQFESLKPFVLFDDELDEKTLNCLVTF